MAEETERKVSKVTEGKVTVSESMTAGKILRSFMPQDVGSIGRSMVMEVMLPQLKQTFYNALKNGLDTLFWGPGGPKKNSSSGIGTKVNYTGYSNPGKTTSVVNASRPSATMDPEDVHFETKMDAQDVLDTMLEVIETYGEVSLADFLEISGVANDNYTYRKYGWQSLAGSEIRRLGTGEFYIRMPRVKPL